MSRPEYIERRFEFIQSARPYEGHKLVEIEIIHNKGRLPKSVRVETRKERKEARDSVARPNKIELSEEQIKVRRRIATILVLGQENTINPCNGCPKKDANLLCIDRDNIRLNSRGSVLCPDGKGVINLLSVMK